MSSCFRDSQTASFIFNQGKSSVHAHSTNWSKMATSDFGPVTVTSCETVLFFTSIWIISWDATNRSTTQHLTDHLTALTGKSGLPTSRKLGGGRVYLGRRVYSVEYGIEKQ